MHLCYCSSPLLLHLFLRPSPAFFYTPIISYTRHIDNLIVFPDLLSTNRRYHFIHNINIILLYHILVNFFRHIYPLPLKTQTPHPFLILLYTETSISFHILTFPLIFIFISYVRLENTHAVLHSRI